MSSASCVAVIRSIASALKVGSRWKLRKVHFQVVLSVALPSALTSGHWVHQLKAHESLSGSSKIDNLCFHIWSLTWSFSIIDWSFFMTDHTSFPCVQRISLIFSVVASKHFRSLRCGVMTSHVPRGCFFLFEFCGRAHWWHFCRLLSFLFQARSQVQREIVNTTKHYIASVLK